VKNVIKKRDACDICEKCANRRQVFYNSHDCLKQSCKALAIHIHVVCNECEALGRNPTCDKCGKLSSSISCVNENRTLRWVCNNCRDNKLNTCDICEVNDKTRLLIIIVLNA
jgi:hypothetical protein